MALQLDALAEIRAEDPVYLASKKLDVVERLHAVTALNEEERANIKNVIMGSLFPGSGSKSLAQRGLVHASEFLHEKSLEGYTWSYKTVETAAAQLTKVAKKIWQKDGYEAAKDSVTLKSGRTVDAYIFPIQYAEKALAVLVEKGKIIVAM